MIGIKLKNILLLPSVQRHYNIRNYGQISRKPSDTRSQDLSLFGLSQVSSSRLFRKANLTVTDLR